MAFLISRYDAKSSIYARDDHYARASLHPQLIPNKSFDFKNCTRKLDLEALNTTSESSRLLPRV